jgi:hypothetical protein
MGGNRIWRQRKDVGGDAGCLQKGGGMAYGENSSQGKVSSQEIHRASPEKRKHYAIIAVTVKLIGVSFRVFAEAIFHEPRDPITGGGKTDLELIRK